MDKPGIFLRGMEKALFDLPENAIGERELVYAIDTGEIGTRGGWIGVDAIGRKASIPLAALTSPYSYISPYKIHYYNSYIPFPDDFEEVISSDRPYGIRIKNDGIYECFAGHRVGDGNYIGIGIDGSRYALQDRMEGIWSHDHAGQTHNWAKSYYLGELYAGEIITAGPPVNYGRYDTSTRSGTNGFLSIKKVSEIRQ
jgi:hypothetical protein